MNNEGFFTKDCCLWLLSSVFAGSQVFQIHLRMSFITITRTKHFVCWTLLSIKFWDKKKTDSILWSKLWITIIHQCVQTMEETYKPYTTKGYINMLYLHNAGLGTNIPMNVYSLHSCTWRKCSEYYDLRLKKRIRFWF